MAESDGQSNDELRLRRCNDAVLTLQLVAVSDSGLTPVSLNDFLFELNRPPDAVFEVQTPTSDGQINVRVVIELAAVGI